MATYAIGDIQGCYSSLCSLLEKIQFDVTRDHLWFAGDLVNRGPESLETLRYVKSLGDRAVTVLGNHDIHLLALYYGVRERRRKDNTLFPILDVVDSDELIQWLQAQPLIHIENNYLLVHAGIHPRWSMQTVLGLKNELESTVNKTLSKQSLSTIYGNTEGSWEENEHGSNRLRYALNCVTRMRYCTTDAEPEYQCSVTPGNQPDCLTPWFEIPNPEFSDYTILFGHWAALGYHQHQNTYALDSGCVWGNALTALRLEDKQVFSVSCSAN